MKNQKIKIGLVVLGGLFLLPLASMAGYDCSYSPSAGDIPEGTNDQKCIDQYYACQDENEAVRQVWGNCTGWGAEEGIAGCHGITREAWLINPTLCPEDYQSAAQFQPDYDWGDENLAYCQCVEKCGPEPIAKDCFPVLNDCCAKLAVIEESEALSDLPEANSIEGLSEECPESDLSAQARLTKILNQYYETIPEGPTKSGRINNIYNVFSDDFSEYACGGYQSKVLDLLNEIKWNDDCTISSLMEGFDYGPIESYFKWHQAVVFYPEGTDWLETGLVLDPWPNQKPEVYTIQEWALKFSKGSYYGIAGSSAYDTGYPTVGGNYIDPAIADVETQAVKDFQKTLSPQKLKKFQQLTANQRKAYVHWLTTKSEVRIHIHSPVRVIVTDAKGNKIGENAQGEFVDQAEDVYMRIEQMDDKHYTYDIYAPKGEYEINMAGTAKGKVKVISAIFNEKKDSFAVQEGDVSVTKGENINLKASSKNAKVTSKKIDFKTVKKAEDIKNLPKPSQAKEVDDIGAWFAENWSAYYSEPEVVQPSPEIENNNININTMTWILYGLAGLVFFVAVVTAIVLLVLKKKFLIVVLIFIPLLFVSCGLGGAATWKLFADLDEVELEPGPVIINTATDATLNTNVATSTSAVKTPKATSDTTILNEDYGFQVDVGAKHVDNFIIQPNDPQGFAEASYMYCYKTSEDWEDTFYCPYGYAPSFSIDVMTKKQWDEASSSPMSVYTLLDKASNRYFAFSHPNGLLPDDVPATESFYEQVQNSFEFLP